jgi:hypothetical protein
MERARIEPLGFVAPSPAYFSYLLFANKYVYVRWTGEIHVPHTPGRGRLPANGGLGRYSALVLEFCHQPWRWSEPKNASPPRRIDYEGDYATR